MSNFAMKSQEKILTIPKNGTIMKLHFQIFKFYQKFLFREVFQKLIEKTRKK